MLASIKENLVIKLAILRIKLEKNINNTNIKFENSYTYKFSWGSFRW